MIIIIIKKVLPPFTGTAPGKLNSQTETHTLILVPIPSHNSDPPSLCVCVVVEERKEDTVP